MAKANFTGPMAAATLDNLTITKSVETEPTLGPTSERTKAPGPTTKWMALACLHGPMADNTSESIAMTISTATASSYGLMANDTKAAGAKDTSMAVV